MNRITNSKPRNDGRKVRGRTAWAAKAMPGRAADNGMAGQPTDTRTPAKAVEAREPSKLNRMLDLLHRDDGATLAELVEATGWQGHSVRGAMAGALKRKGHVVTSEKTDGQRRYRIGPVS